MYSLHPTPHPRALPTPSPVPSPPFELSLPLTAPSPHPPPPPSAAEGSQAPLPYFHTSTAHPVKATSLTEGPVSSHFLSFQLTKKEKGFSTSLTDSRTTNPAQKARREDAGRCLLHPLGAPR